MKRIVKKIMPILTILSCFATHAQNTTIKVLDASTEPLANIVVYLEPEDKSIITQNFLSVTDAATMDQVNRQFLPHILVVHKNTQIDFPNSDKIKHHVYSFSPAKTFEIKLYSDKPSGPRLFDHVGEVTLGCNIHDWMLGYVYVVDTPWFGKTDAKGSINFDIPEGIKITVEKQTIIKISGFDKQQIGMVVSKIKSFRTPEPYKGKGIREQGQYIIRKEGKKK